MSNLGFGHWKLRNKILAIVATSILISAGLVGGFTTYQMVTKAKGELANWKVSRLIELRQKLKDIVDAGYMVLEKTQAQTATIQAIEEIHGQSLRSMMDVPLAILQKEYSQIDTALAMDDDLKKVFMAQATRNAQDVIRAIRFGHGNYFWINDLTPRIVMHPIMPELEGRDVSNLSLEGQTIVAEGTQTPVFKEFVRVARSSPDGGLILYRWPDPRLPDRWIRKVSLVRLFKPFNWVVGTGFDLEEFEAEARAKAAITIGSMHYGRGDFLFIMDTNGQVQTHEDPTLKDKNLAQTRSADGRPVYQEMLDQARTKGQGSLEYSWNKAGLSRAVPKMAYFRIFKPWNWVIGTEVNLDDLEREIADRERESRDKLTDQVTFILVATIGLMILALAGAFIISLRHIERPVRRTAELLEDIAQGQGDLTRRLPEVSRDEVGRLAAGFNLFVDHLRTLIQAVGKEMGELNKAADDLSAVSTDMETKAADLGASADSSAKAVGKTAGNIERMAAAAEEVSTQVAQVARASEQSSANMVSVGTSARNLSADVAGLAASAEEMSQAVRTVATAIEEMYASLNEVAKNASRGAFMTNTASGQATESAQTVNSLGQSAREIGEVVDLIRGIAAQTNLLALNATIEAASAGEAGKGFAVVANEVKALAKQTAAATERIRDKVGAIQNSTDSAVKAISHILAFINEVNGIMNAIASAVEEQTATTNEISKHISEVAMAADSVAINVMAAAKEAEDASAGVQGAVRAGTEVALNLEQVAKAAQAIAGDAAEAARRTATAATGVDQVNTAVKTSIETAARTKSAATDLATLAGRLRSLIGRFHI